MTHTRIIRLIARLARALDKRGASDAHEGLPIDPALLPIDLTESGIAMPRNGN